MLEYVRRVRGLREAFRRCFMQEGKPTDDGKAVLKELRRFCCGNAATIKSGMDGRIDPYASIAAAARQEVYQRIVTLLYISDADLNRLENQTDE